MAKAKQDLYPIGEDEDEDETETETETEVKFSNSKTDASRNLIVTQLRSHVINIISKRGLTCDCKSLGIENTKKGSSPRSPLNPQ